MDMLLSWNSSTPDDDQTPDLMLASAHPKKRAGRKKFTETRHPVYRGVRQKSIGKWVCELREPNKKTRIWLGTYPTPEMAARAHDAAALVLRGRSGACLNFADSAWLLCDGYVPASTSSKDIQRAAFRFAHAFGSGGPTADPVDESEDDVVVEGYFLNNYNMDEDVSFLMAEMYQGLMMPPPEQELQTCLSGFDADLDFFPDVSLWNYSR